MRTLKWIIAAAVSLGVVAGCGDNGTSPKEALVARGDYIVNHVAACIDCHTPRNLDGTLDRTKLLSGTFFADIVPNDSTLGAIYTPNLTPDSTGLQNWTDAQIKNAFQNGIDDENAALFPIMPYWVFHNMTADDADAIVAYLRSIPAVTHHVPKRQPLGFPFTTAALPIPLAAIPNTTLPIGDAHYANAVRGRYLATMAGVCIECHTVHQPGPNPVKLDSLFAGGEAFEIGAPFPDLVYSANITPDSTGIKDVTPVQIRTELLTAIDPTNEHLCPPMPAGPGEAFGGLTQEDALDIGWYITTMRPLTHRVPNCHPPGPGAH
jgi:mono/diheme cytochrome c family protein